MSTKTVMETPKAARKCAHCIGDGFICNNCGWSKRDCDCAKREHAETGAPLGMNFEPYECDECDGTGEVK